MKLIAKAYEIDDYDVDRIESKVIETICEELECGYNIPFVSLEEESQMALVSKVFEKLKNDIKEEVF